MQWDRSHWQDNSGSKRGIIAVHCTEVTVVSTDNCGLQCSACKTKGESSTIGGVHCIMHASVRGESLQYIALRSLL